MCVCVSRNLLVNALVIVNVWAFTRFCVVSFLWVNVWSWFFVCLSEQIY